MANDLIRFANSVELVTGKKRGRKPVFFASQFYPYQQERELQGAVKKEFLRFIENALQAATVGIQFSDDIGELSDLGTDLPEDFLKQVERSAESIGRKAITNFANQSEMIIGKPYYPGEAKNEILKNWESNFQLLCKSAESDVKKDIAQIITQAKNEGWNKNQLEKAVKSKLPEKYKNRAELIARTETAKLNSEINRATYKEVGIEYYVWMTTIDGRERGSHAEMNNVICSVSNPDVYYEENPKDPMHPIEKPRAGNMVHLHPGEDFQCRCSMVMWDPYINGSYEVKEEQHSEPEEKPKTTSEILQETEKQLENARKQLEAANRKTELLQQAQARHAARTQAEREEIIKRLNNRLEVRKLTKVVVKEAEGINGVELDKLKELMKGGSKKQYVEMNNLANEIKSKVEELKGLKFVQNPLQVAKDFDYQTAVTIEKSVKAKVDKWDKYNVSLAERKNKLEYEIKWVEDNKKYQSWKVAQDAYKKLLVDVNKDIQVETINSKLPEIKKYASTHKKFKNIQNWISELENMVVNKSAYTEAEMLKQLQKVEKEQARIKQFDPKPAINNSANDLTYISNKEAKKLIQEFRKVTDDRADAAFRPLSEQLWAQYSQEEKMVLTKYTQTYSYLNEPLRKIKYLGERPLSEYTNDLPIMTNAIEKSVIPNDIVVTRGTKDFMTSAGVDLSALKKGDTFIDGAFLSTAVKEGKGLNKTYTLKIAVPKGAKGIYAEPFTHYNDAHKHDFDTGVLWNGKNKESFGGEREMILQRGSKLEVVEVHGKTIYCKLIGQLYNQP